MGDTIIAWCREQVLGGLQHAQLSDARSEDHTRALFIDTPPHAKRKAVRHSHEKLVCCVPTSRQPLCHHHSHREDSQRANKRSAKSPKRFPRPLLVSGPKFRATRVKLRSQRLGGCLKSPKP